MGQVHKLITYSKIIRKTKAIARHKGILKYLTKELEITSEEDAENNEYQLNIYVGNINTWDFIIIILIYIPFRLVRNFNEDTHEA